MDTPERPYITGCGPDSCGPPRSLGFSWPRARLPRPPRAHRRKLLIKHRVVRAGCGEPCVRAAGCRSGLSWPPSAEASARECLPPRGRHKGLAEHRYSKLSCEPKPGFVNHLQPLERNPFGLSLLRLQALHTASLSAGLRWRRCEFSSISTYSYFHEKPDSGGLAPGTEGKQLRAPSFSCSEPPFPLQEIKRGFLPPPPLPVSGRHQPEARK